MLYHSAIGSVNYTIVGSPAIVDGILENPNRQNYIKTDTTFQDTGEDFRLHVEFVRTISRTVPVLGTNQTGGARPLLALDASKPRFRIGTGVNIYGVQSLWRTNTPYAIEVSRTGNIWTLKSFMNGNQVDIQTLESSALLNDGAAFTWVFGCDFAVYGGGIEGNIDLNKTYINYDKEAWFGICPIEVKKHQIMGPVGYTVVGSPTITDGVASGFSNTSPYSYLQVDGFSFANRFGIKCRFQYKTGFDLALIFGIANENGTVVLTSGAIRVQLYPGKRMIVSNTMVDNTWYKFLYTYDGDKTYSLSLYDDNNTLIGTVTDTSEIALPQTNYIRIGSIRASSLAGTFTGSIDLNNTYIKVNGKLWYWQPQATKYIQRNNQLVFADPKLYLSGPVNYTVVGSPTIVDGVVSGFTTTDYITTQSTPQDTDVRNYELFTKIKINSIPTSTEFIMCYEAGSREGISIINDGRIRFQTSRAIGTTGEPSIYSSACSVGDEVLIHTYYKGNNIWVLEISKDNGVTWETNTLTVTSELSEMNTSRVITIGGSPFYSSGYKSPFASGSIDLNNTYIKINDQLWFYGKNYATQNIAPVPSGYTFGTTTTSSIGYVDMRTQTFYSAPQGAIIGRDE